jgi:tetratricopeptide (TPR) repeat protein
LSEASILAASELEQDTRSVAFGEIAIAQGYLGDFVGARMSIDNGGRDNGKQQLLAKLAESLIGLERYYEALDLMSSLDNEVEYSRLELRLCSNLIHSGRVDEALSRLDQSSPRVSRIYDLSERGLITSQYARLYMRIDQKDKAERLFSDALDLSEQLAGRKSQINRGIVALDWSRSLQIGKANVILEEVVDSTIRNPIDDEIMATKRIIETLLPASILEQLTADD